MYRMQKEIRKRTLKLLRLDKKFRAGANCLLCGVDEAGRGPLAGPVVATAVIFEKGAYIEGVFDSKQLNACKREEMFDHIVNNAVSYGIGICDNIEIDLMNIYNATILAMSRAISGLSLTPDVVIVDGNFYRDERARVINIIRGDEKSFSIAAASIIAKVTRDRMMKEYENLFPNFSFSKHKGYCTKKHVEELKLYGYTEIHRQSFKVMSLEEVEQINVVED